MTSPEAIPIRAILLAAGILALAMVGRWLLASPWAGDVGAWVGPALVPLWLTVASEAHLRRYDVGVQVNRGGQRAWLQAVAPGLLLVWLVGWAVVSARESIQLEPAPALYAQVLLVSLVPLGEELFFRGVLLGLARRFLGNGPAVVAVSALFGALHPWGPLTAIMAGFSVLLCFTVLSSGSLLWAIAIHMAWNGLSTAWTQPDAGNRFWLLALTGVALLALIVRGLRTRESPCR